MALRSFAAGAARMSSGFWREVAAVVDPKAARTTPVVEPPAGPVASPTVAAPPIAPEREAVVTDRGSGASVEGATAAADGLESVEEQPAGVLVPVDTWTRILDQLGNLHQAGQELAEARERAAKAETEATFLREQLKAKRQRLQRRAPASPATPAAEPEVIDLRSPARRGVRRARSTVSGWIRP